MSDDPAQAKADSHPQEPPEPQRSTDIPETAATSPPDGPEAEPVEEAPAPSEETGSDEAEPDSRYLERDELRVPESLKAEVNGPAYEAQDFHDNVTYGPSASGRNIVQNNFADRRLPDFQRPPAVEELARCYAPTATDKELENALGWRATVCLIGAPGSGRFSAACRFLMNRLGPDHVTEILPPLDQSAADAVHDIKSLRPEHGYLLRIFDEDAAPIISRLDAVVKAAGSLLILIRDVAPRAAIDSEAEICHIPPVPHAVFAAHVSNTPCARREDPETYLRLVHEGAPLPELAREAAVLAKRVIQLPKEEARELLVSEDGRTRRKNALSILAPSCEDALPSRRRLRQHRRAFRLAYAALRGNPIGHVFTATGWLLSELDAESGWDDLGRTALECSLKDLLGTELAAQWEHADTYGTVGIKSNLVGPIFSAAWHEFDHTRPALIAWLHSLVEADDASRQAAVRVAATLAQIDFGEILVAVIEPWSQSGKFRVREAAAQTVAILSATHTLNNRVMRIVHSWVWHGTRRQRATTAAAYASGLRQRDARWTLADLGDIANDPMQRHDWTIAEGIRQLLKLHGPAVANLVVATLAAWIRSDDPARLATRHAARSLIRVADLTQQNRWDRPPLLVAGLADGTVSAAELAVLWYAALLGTSTQSQAWPVLLDWLRHADDDAGLRTGVGALVTEIAGAANLRRRMRLFLSRPDTPEWIAKLIEEWRR
ncbi:hypothetical protein AB0M02_22835 [Actinoplanes sp. NPDC051861]|uniref:hypothetical protein n=1 Tax=Actinoplanes sp. NPDC051861 TaxID=3155170 RepID=UPI00343AF388